MLNNKSTYLTDLFFVDPVFTGWIGWTLMVLGLPGSSSPISLSLLPTAPPPRPRPPQAPDWHPKAWVYTQSSLPLFQLLPAPTAEPVTKGLLLKVS